MVDDVKQVDDLFGLSCISGELPACAPGACAESGDMAPAREIQLLLLAIGERLRQHVAAVAARFDFTPQQVLLLDHLAARQTMGQLAGTLGCDPSNVTGLIRRLEQRGLVAREPDHDDRRTRWLSLTEAGARAREEFRNAIFQDSTIDDGLDIADQERFLAMLRSVAGNVGLTQPGR